LGECVGEGDALGDAGALACGDAEGGGVTMGCVVGACATFSVFGGPLKTRASA
jgi:hypothetical protein